MVKASAKKSVNSESVVAPKEVEVHVVAVPPSKSAKRSNKTAQEAAPVAIPIPVAPPVVQETAPAQTGGKKSKKTSTPAPVVEVVAPVVQETAPDQTGGKKSKKTTTPAPVAEVAAPTPVAEVAEQKEGSQGRGKRFFRCVYRATDGSVVNAGRYSGKKPKQAAAKALTAIVKKNNVTTGESVTFLIQECTRGSRKKKYSYEGSQVFLPNPVEITIKKKDGTSSSISYAKNNVLKKVALTECGDLVNVELGEEEAQPEVADVKVQTATTSTARSNKRASKGGKAAKSSAKKT
jgi:hypothetical protein